MGVAVPESGPDRARAKGPRRSRLTEGRLVMARSLRIASSQMGPVQRADPRPRTLSRLIALLRKARQEVEGAHLIHDLGTLGHLLVVVDGQLTAGRQKAQIQDKKSRVCPTAKRPGPPRDLSPSAHR